tara:strand:+ start:524 stop:1126 length:603 start_codon:yes stop_codon:yes gene_type:complete
MAIQLTFSNILQLTSTLSPVLITFFLVMLSLFNLNLKGIMYLSGVMLATFINYMLGFAWAGENKVTPPAMCNLLEGPWTQHTDPSSSTLYLAFTLVYLFMPMYFNDQMNLYLVTTLLVILGVDMITKVQNTCTSTMGAVLGAVLGGSMGLIWYGLFKSSGMDQLLYFEEFQSNKPYCSKPSKQKFKCRNTKSGEIITTIN